MPSAHCHTFRGTEAACARGRGVREAGGGRGGPLKGYTRRGVSFVSALVPDGALRAGVGRARDGAPLCAYTAVCVCWLRTMRLHAFACRAVPCDVLRHCCCLVVTPSLHAISDLRSATVADLPLSLSLCDACGAVVARVGRSASEPQARARHRRSGDATT
jgi:hypothetical protein